MVLQQNLTDTTDDRVLEAGATEMTVAEARELVEEFARVTTSADVDEFCAGFTEDCIVSLKSGETIQGREALRKAIAPNFANKASDNICKKSLRSLNGNVLGVSYLTTWTDPESGKLVKRRGLEFWIMRGRQIARWDFVSIDISN